MGRTGRAGNKGTAVTFVDWDDMPRWGLINKALGLSVPEPVETYSSSPHLFEELDIPEGTKGRLPRDKRVLAGVDAEVLEDLGETGKKNAPRTGQTGGRDSARSGGSRSGGAGAARAARRKPQRGSGDGSTVADATADATHAAAAAPAAEKTATHRRPPSPSGRGRSQHRPRRRRPGQGHRERSDRG